MICDADRALKAVNKILACYPLAKPHDPEAYIAALAAVLEGRPVEQVEIVEGPRRGIASRCSYLPTVADVTKLLDELREAALPPPRREYFRALPFPPPTEDDKAWAKAKVAEMRRDFASRSLDRDSGRVDAREIFRRAQKDRWVG